jgi:hypothetical protein
VTEGAREQQGREIGGINYRTASWLAWAVWVLTVVELPLSAALLFVIPTSSGITNLPDAVGTVVFAALIFTFSTVGVLIATRQPHNLVGWIMLVAGFALGATVLTSTYVDLSITQPRGRLPGTEWVAWFAQWIWVPGFAPALTFLLLLFPNGRLPSGRWRLVGWLAVAAMAILGIGMAFTPGPFVDYPKVTNPLGLAPLEGSFLEGGGVGWLLLPAGVVLSAGSMVVRYRRATGVERQQIKWFALAAAIAAVGWVVITLAYGTDEGTENPLLVAAQLLQLLSFLGLALAVGIAVLKYRLYDIDLLINRTLVYGALTALLVGVYVGSIVVLQGLLRALTGQESQLAIVASTLAVAALFNPLRRHIQSFIDRRFYRSKYDAAKTLETFSAKLRDETDLDALSDDLVGVVRETMQPAHVSLWLRPSTDTRERWKGSSG